MERPGSDRADLLELRLRASRQIPDGPDNESAAGLDGVELRAGPAPGRLQVVDPLTRAVDFGTVPVGTSSAPVPVNLFNAAAGSRRGVLLVTPAVKTTQPAATFNNRGMPPSPAAACH